MRPLGYGHHYSRTNRKKGKYRKGVRSGNINDIGVIFSWLVTVNNCDQIANLNISHFRSCLKGAIFNMRLYFRISALNMNIENVIYLEGNKYTLLELHTKALL